MKTTFEFNGGLRMRMVPEGPVETLILQQMAEQSEKGTTTVIAAPSKGSDEFVLAVGGK